MQTVKFTNLQPDDSVMSDINVTPLVDIMLVLLIVFIITAPVMHQAFHLNLPKENADKLLTDPTFVTIEISSDGLFSLDGAPKSEDDLLGALRTIRKTKGENTQIHIKADQTTQYGSIARLFALSRQAGLTKISFVMGPVTNKDIKNVISKEAEYP